MQYIINIGRSLFCVKSKHKYDILHCARDAVQSLYSKSHRFLYNILGNLPAMLGLIKVEKNMDAKEKILPLSN